MPKNEVTDPAMPPSPQDRTASKDTKNQASRQDMTTSDAEDGDGLYQRRSLRA